MSKQQLLNQNIITALGLEALDDAKKIALLDKMGDLVQKRLVLRLVEQMTEAEKNEFEKLSEAESEPEKIAEFLQKCFPDFFAMAEEEVMRLKQELAGVVKKK
jgi:hypothetical protein